MHSNLTAAAFQCPGDSCTFSNFIYQWGSIINMLIALLAALAVVVFFYGIVKFIFSGGDTQAHRQGYRLLGWGIVAISVLVLLAGILNFFARDIFGASAQAGGPLPSSPGP